MEYVAPMFGWTLLDAVLGGDAELLLGGVDADVAGEEQEQGQEEQGNELVLPDYAESRQAHRRDHGVAG